LRLRFGSWQFTLLCKSLALFLTWDVSSKPDLQDFKLISIKTSLVLTRTLTIHG
jgi:hypothetical protein